MHHLERIQRLNAEYQEAFHRQQEKMLRVEPSADLVATAYGDMVYIRLEQNNRSFLSLMLDPWTALELRNRLEVALPSNHEYWSNLAGVNGNPVERVNENRFDRKSGV